MILVSEWMPADDILRMQRLCHRIRYCPDLGADPDRLAVNVKDALALVVRNQTRVTERLLAAAPNLKVVGRLGVGYDNLDLSALAARQIPVVYAKGANAVAVTEYVIGALLAVCRPWRDWIGDTRQGQWNRYRPGRELGGSTLGVVGAGDIGARVIRAARALGCHVLAYDPRLLFTDALFSEGWALRVDRLEDLLAASDFVTLHAPATQATHHLIDASRLSAMKAGAWLINTARGSLVDERALEDAVRAGHLGGAVLDVRHPEPPTLPDPLAVFPNVWLTPHLAGLTPSALSRAGTMVLDDILRVLAGQEPRCPLRPR